MEFLGFLIIGGLAGWIAGLIMRGRGFGIAGNIAVGIVGALLGGWLFGVFGFGARGAFGAFILALIGSIILLFLVGLFRKT